MGTRQLDYILLQSLCPTESIPQVAVLQKSYQLVRGIAKKDGAIEHHLRYHLGDIMLL